MVLTTTLTLAIALGMLMIDSIIELSFITSMVSWLHIHGGQNINIDIPDSTLALHGAPLHILVNQGHTSNGAAGTAFVLIGLGGILALWLRSRRNFHSSKLSVFWYHFWGIMTVLSTVLTLSALIYTFVVTAAHHGQSINLTLATSLDNRLDAGPTAYPDDAWTPENWFTAVLQLDLSNNDDRADIRHHLDVMKAWRWNLIPMFIVGLAVCILAIMDSMRRKRADAKVNGSYSAVASTKMDA